MHEKQEYYTQETTGIRYKIGDLYGYPDSLIRGRTGAAYRYGLPLISNNPTTVLDFGSGRGHGVKAIQEQLKPATIVSVDKYMPYMIAQKKALQTGTPVPNFVNAGSNLPFAAGSFDAVTLMHVIEHIRDPKALLKDLHRVMALNGQLLIATPDIRNLVGTNPYDEHVFAADELHDVLTSTGFDPKLYYVVPNETANKVHRRKKWLGTHAPFTAKIRNKVNPRLWDAAVFRSGISRLPLTIEDFNLSEEYHPNTIDLLAVGERIA